MALWPWARYNRDPNIGFKIRGSSNKLAHEDPRGCLSCSNIIVGKFCWRALNFKAVVHKDGYLISMGTDGEPDRAAPPPPPSSSPPDAQPLDSVEIDYSNSGWIELLRS